MTTPRPQLLCVACFSGDHQQCLGGACACIHTPALAGETPRADETPLDTLIERMITQAFVSGQMDAQATRLEKQKVGRGGPLKALSQQAYVLAEQTAQGRQAAQFTQEILDLRQQVKELQKLVAIHCDRLQALEQMGNDWKQSAEALRLNKGQRGREKRGHEVLANCAYDLLAALTAPSSTRQEA